MKRILSLVFALVLIFGAPLSTYAAEDGTASIEQKEQELEQKYGIGIEYATDREGNPTISLNSLITLDMALENVTPNVVRQVSEYYRGKNGSRLVFRYVQKTANLTAGSEAVLAGFDNERSLIELYIPASSSTIIATGEYPISIVHEFGHALHLMYTDQYGFERMRKEWATFNQGISYQPANIEKNPNDKVFVTGYAATMFEEDVAEVIGHVFVRNRAGQGLKSRLVSDGNYTSLGQKVAYVEKMLSAYLTNTEDAVANYRRIYETASAINYQGMRFAGEYLQFSGYPQPRYVLNGTLNSLGLIRTDALWLRSIGGWYVKLDTGEQIIVFPGGVWCDVSASFQVPV